MNRALIIIGILIVLVGLFWKQLAGLPFFKLPGDIVIDRPGLKVFFPITTMIVISLVVSLLLWLFRGPGSRPGVSVQLGGGSVGGVSWEHAWPAIRVRRA